MEAGKPSRTAEYVALFRALETLRPTAQRQFQDPQARRFLRPSLRLLTLLGSVAPVRAGIEAYIDRRWPGPRPSAVARTRVIDDFLADAVGGGVRCVANLSGGPVDLPPHAAVLLASGPLTGDGKLPTDTAVWLGV